MKRSPDDIILCLIAALSVAAAAVVALQPFTSQRRLAVESAFQSALGGLGMGCQVDLSRCSYQFDPRISTDDHPGLDDIPALSEVCPWHAIALFPPPSNQANFEGE
jgi:hypothetical protein